MIKNISKVFVMAVLAALISSCAFDGEDETNEAKERNKTMVLKEGFIQADLDTGEIPDILIQKARAYTFPLTKEEREELAQFEARYDPENDIIAFAGPQVNLPRAVIHFEAPEKYRKFRPDLTQTMPRTLWLNPSYEPLSDEKSPDYEGCFSVKKYAAEVDRYAKIRYTAYDKEGQKIEGVAEGFLARMIQHEIDHVNGVLFTSLANPGTRMTHEDYRALKRKRAEESESRG